MLQTNPTGTCLDFTVFHPACGDGSDPSDSDLKPVKAPCLVTAQMVDLFAEITGWDIEFCESTASLQRRKMLTDDAPAEGTFSIVDMSASWPAQTPTGHRAKCDEMVSLIGELVSELQTTRLDLSKTRSALAALDPTVDIADHELVDSFVPKFSFGRRWDDVDPTAIPSHGSQAEQIDDTEFEFHQETADSPIGLVQPPFEGWNLGGNTGIANQVYLDWLVDVEEQISIFGGRIESDFGTGDTQAMLRVDPLTSEYIVESETDFQVFHLWDSKDNTLSVIESTSSWQPLTPGQAIVAVTAGLNPMQSSLEAGSELDDCTAERLAQILTDSLGDCEKLLVLKRD